MTQSEKAMATIDDVDNELTALGDEIDATEEKTEVNSVESNEGGLEEIPADAIQNESIQVDLTQVDLTQVDLIQVDQVDANQAAATTGEEASDGPMDEMENNLASEPSVEPTETISAEPVAVEPVAVEPVAVEPEVEATEVEATVAAKRGVAEPIADEVDAEPIAEEPASGFGGLGLSDILVKTVEQAGYSTPTPIQAETIPLLAQGRDVLGQAQTGTGKTAAFALPLLSRVKLAKKQPQVLVLAPTRELAIQVTESFEKYAKDMRGFRAVSIYGGQDYQVQLRQLSRGVHVIVGTPGRVMDHMRRGSLKLDALQCLVLDEADEMLRMGFADDVEWVLTQAPAQRQMALFSATMPDPIRQIAQKHLKNPAQITIKQRAATADTVNQRYIVAAPHQKKAALVRILESESTDGVLVFVKMRSTTEPLAEHLASAGLKTAALNGDIAQSKREKIVEMLRSGKIDVIVATDVAARGLDVQRISHVVNYDLPHDSEAYVHRIGRTGRAGRLGEAILFVGPRESYQLKRLEKATRQPIAQMTMPTKRDINKQRIARFHEKITEGFEHKEIQNFKSIIEQYRRDNEDASLEMIAASLAVLANQENPLLVKDDLENTKFSDNNRRKDQGHSGGRRDYQSDRRSGPRSSSPRSGSPRSSSPRSSSPRSDARGNEAGMETYRIEVGRQHGVQPGNIVGAIANEGGIGSSSIGRIKIFDSFSMVDLPEGISGGTLSTLENVFVAGQKLRISKMGERPQRDGGSRPPRGGKRPFNKTHQKSKFKPKGKKAYAGN